MSWDNSDWESHLWDRQVKSEKQNDYLKKKVKRLEKKIEELEALATHNQARELGKILDADSSKKRREAERARKAIAPKSTQKKGK